MQIKKIHQDFTVCQVEDYSLVNLDSEYSFIAKTEEEKSLVCITSNVPANDSVENLSDAVMVGDREHDILGAHQVGMDSIGVLYGYGDYEELSKAEIQIVGNTELLWHVLDADSE